MVYYQNAPVSFNETGCGSSAHCDGKFYRATDTQSLASIYQDSTKLKNTISAGKISEYRDLFPECIAAGLGLLIGQLCSAKPFERFRSPERCQRLAEQKSCPISNPKPAAMHSGNRSRYS